MAREFISPFTELFAERHVPDWIGQLHDIFFYNSLGETRQENTQWHNRFFAAWIPGIDQGFLWNQWAIYLCETIRPFIEDEFMINEVCRLHRLVISGTQTSIGEWQAIGRTAWSARMDTEEKRPFHVKCAAGVVAWMSARDAYNSEDRDIGGTARMYREYFPLASAASRALIDTENTIGLAVYPLAADKFVYLLKMARHAQKAAEPSLQLSLF